MAAKFSIRITKQRIALFLIWPFLAPALLIVIAAMLVIAWPFTLTADFE